MRQARRLKPSRASAKTSSWSLRRRFSTPGRTPSICQPCWRRNSTSRIGQGKASNNWRARSASRLELGMAEIQGQGEAVGGAIGRTAQRLVQGLVEATQGQPVHRLASQFADAAQRRDHPVATGLGQQRTVVAEAEVLVAAAQVDHLHAAAAVVARRLLEVFLGGEYFLAGQVGGPVLASLDDDHQAAAEVGESRRSGLLDGGHAERPVEGG